MIIYLIKSTLSLAVIIAAYIFYLQCKPHHNFNRFYLLFGLFLSFVIPIIPIYDVFSITHHVAVIPVSNFSDPVATGTLIESDTAMLQWTLFDLICLIVLVGIFIKGVIFIYNLFDIIIKCRINKKLTYQEAFLILIHDKIVPHTFFKYIFINKQSYEDQSISSDLLNHELAHARELHSLDIIVIELLQIVFWFNPLLIIYKKAMRLNHEFIADKYVANRTQHLGLYQHMLLNFSSIQSTAMLSSSLTYSITKKRLDMMTTTTSKWSYLKSSLLSFVLFAALLFSFGTGEAQKTKVADDGSKVITKDEYFKHASFAFTNDDGTITYKKYSSMSDEEKSNIPPPPPPPPGLSQSEIEKLLAPLAPGTIIQYNHPGYVRRYGKNRSNIPPPPPPPAPPAPPAHAAPPAPPAPPTTPIHSTPPTPPTPPVHAAPPAPPTHAAPPAPPTSPTAPMRAAPPAPPAPPVHAAPPAPPLPPPSPLEYIEQMAAEGATFKLNDKEISSAEAIRIIKRESIISVSSNQTDGNPPVISIKM